MCEEELREIIEAKNKPIRDVVELSKHFRGRRNCIVFLTESFRIDLDNRMSRLAMLEVENKKLREEIENIKKEVQEHIAFENRLKRDGTEPDLFNQGRFYVANNIKDILDGKEII